MNRSMAAVSRGIATGWVVPGLSKATKPNEGKTRHRGVLDCAGAGYGHRLHARRPAR